jgi:hypothetical protein
MFRTLCRISPLGNHHRTTSTTRNTDNYFPRNSWRGSSHGWPNSISRSHSRWKRLCGTQKVDFREILTLREAVRDLVRSKGVKHTVGVLRSFHSALKESAWDVHPNYIPALFHDCSRITYQKPRASQTWQPEDTFSCYHVSVTPTAMKVQRSIPGTLKPSFPKIPRPPLVFHPSELSRRRPACSFASTERWMAPTFVKKRYGTILRETGLKIWWAKVLVPRLLAVSPQGTFCLVHASVQEQGWRPWSTPPS